MTSFSAKTYTYLGAFALTLMLIALLPLMGMFPPIEPSLTADEVAAHYRDNATGVIVGGILILLSSMLILPFMGVLSVFMKRMEGRDSPMTYAFIALAGLAFATLFISGLGFTLAAYRPEASPETIRMLSDFSILMLVLPGIILAAQCAMLGVVILGDRRAAPIFPRWVGYVQLFAAVLSLPGAAVALFKAGPFAWNGAIAFWMPTVMFAIWFNVCLWAIMDALKRKVLDEA